MIGLSISQTSVTISGSTAKPEIVMKFLVIVLAIWAAAASAAPERERRSLGLPGSLILGGLSPLGLGHAGILGLGVPGVAVVGPASGSVAVVGPSAGSAAVVGPAAPAAAVIGPVGPSAAIVGPAAGATIVAGPAGAIHTGGHGLILPGLIHG
ncbi:RNA-binding protein 12 [Fopius arisanus]|uniref:RNA-binding protein 12 n=2 Tax=Fopius arisanus TaxID=64838 RepID=A0A9R1TZJ7_9HYME|nr:PREDICTED: RNA-binding protein 12-like [Fopius arisanus]